MIKYQLEVYTGSQENALTSASVSVNVCADDGCTGRRALKKSLNNSTKFAVGQVSLAFIPYVILTFQKNQLMYCIFYLFIVMLSILIKYQ